MTNRPLPTTRGRRRTEEVAEILRREIVAGLVAGTTTAGDSLPAEPDLLARFDLSRPTLREAMRLLESEGVVEFRVGQAGGAFVVEPQADLAARRVATMLQVRSTTVADVWRLRGELACVAARLVAAAPSRPAVAQLREQQAALAAAPDAGPPMPRSAVSFDDTLVAAAGNDTLAILWDVLRHIVMRQTELVTETFASEQPPHLIRRRNRALARAVAQLIDLIEAGDPDGAEAFWRRHVESIERMLRDLMGRTVLTQPVDASW